MALVVDGEEQPSGIVRAVGGEDFFAPEGRVRWKGRRGARGGRAGALARFSFPAIQFIATAHSPLIAQAAENANLAVLREENGKVIIKRHPQSVNTWRADQILASDLFDISTRSGSIQKLIKERDELLDKMKRNHSEEERLKQLEEKLDLLPTAEDPENQAAIELIRSVAASLKDNRSHQS